MTQWEKLLGGYATGTLTGEERTKLMQAALSDQALFDVLMDEEALRETLADPATRAALLRALEPAAKAVAWWRNPWPWTGLGAVAAAVALFVVLRPADAPKPVQVAQNLPVAAAPEPVPVVIETPRQLQPSRSVSARKPLEPSLPQRTEAKMTAMAPPAPAAPAAESAVKDESAGARSHAPVPASAPITRQKAAAEAVAEPLAVALSYQDEDGAWRPLELQSAVPANRPLRLRVTSTQAGVLALQPRLAEARSLIAGVPSEVALPAQPAGSLRLSLLLIQPPGQAFGRVANELRESKSRAMAAADSALAQPAPSLTREILLRIE
jgi:hypothetical protein